MREKTIKVTVGDVVKANSIWVVLQEDPCEALQESLENLRSRLGNLFAEDEEEEIDQNTLFDLVEPEDALAVRQYCDNGDYRFERAIAKRKVLIGSRKLFVVFLVDQGKQSVVPVTSARLVPKELEDESANVKPLAQLLELKEVSVCAVTKKNKEFAEKILQLSSQCWIEDLEEASAERSLRGHLYCSFSSPYLNVQLINCLEDNGLDPQKIDPDMFCLNSALNDNVTAREDFLFIIPDEAAEGNSAPVVLKQESASLKRKTPASLSVEPQTKIVRTLLKNVHGKEVDSDSENILRSTRKKQPTLLKGTDSKEIMITTTTDTNIEPSEEKGVAVFVSIDEESGQQQDDIDIANAVQDGVDDNAVKLPSLEEPENEKPSSASSNKLFVKRKRGRPRKKGKSAGTRALNSRVFNHTRNYTAVLENGVHVIPVSTSIRLPNLNGCGIIMNQTFYCRGSILEVKGNLERICYVGRLNSDLEVANCDDQALIMTSRGVQKARNSSKKKPFVGYKDYLSSRLWVTIKALTVREMHEPVNQVQFSWRPDELDYSAKLASQAPVRSSLRKAEAVMIEELYSDLEETFRCTEDMCIPRPSAGCLPSSQTLLTSLGAVDTLDMLSQSLGSLTRTDKKCFLNRDVLINGPAGFPYLPQVHRFHSSQSNQYYLQVKIIHYTKCELPIVNLESESPLHAAELKYVHPQKRKDKADTTSGTHSEFAEDARPVRLPTNPLGLDWTASQPPNDVCRVELNWAHRVDMAYSQERYKAKDKRKSTKNLEADNEDDEEYAEANFRNHHESDKFRRCVAIPDNKVQLDMYLGLGHQDSSCPEEKQRKYLPCVSGLAEEVTVSSIPRYISRKRLLLMYKYRSLAFRPQARLLNSTQTRLQKLPLEERLQAGTDTNYLQQFENWYPNLNPIQYCSREKNKGMVMVVSNNRILSCMSAAACNSWNPEPLEVEVFKPKLTNGNLLLTAYSLASIVRHERQAATNTTKIKKKISLGLCAFSTSKFIGDDLKVIGSHMRYNNPLLENTRAIATSNADMFSALADGLQTQNCSFVRDQSMTFNTATNSLKVIRRLLLEMELVVAKELGLTFMSWTTYAEKVIRPFQESDLVDIVLSPFEGEEYSINDEEGFNLFYLTMYERALLEEDELRCHEIELIKWLALRERPLTPWKDYVRAKVKADLGLQSYPQESRKLTEKEFDNWSKERYCPDIGDVSGSLILEPKKGKSKRRHPRPSVPQETCDQFFVDDTVVDGLGSSKVISYDPITNETIVTVTPDVDGQINTVEVIEEVEIDDTSNDVEVLYII